jgi:uncharacterized OB-fold protein
MTTDDMSGLPVFDPSDRALLDPSARVFWEMAFEGRLAIQRCSMCRAWRWPPSGFCAACHDWNADWEVVPGNGTLAAVVTLHRSFDPAFADAVPYVIALIAIDGTDGQVMMLSNVVGANPTQVHVGLPVRAVFSDCVTGVRPPVFKVVE